MIEKITIKQVLILSAFLHLCSAFFSTGFQHFDEHFQIYEFLSFKWGHTPQEALPWEYREKIRPWFQVGFYYTLLTPFKAIGINSPFTLALICRLFTSLFGLSALYSWYPLLKRWFKERTVYVFLFWNLSWFIPYIQTRTNSESFAISFFLLGSSLFLRSHKSLRISLFTGILFGLSYHSRFQLASAVAPLWFFGVLKKMPSKHLFGTATGVIISILVGIFGIDYWGYGEANFSLWHYFRMNFLEGFIAQYRSDPYWWYLKLAFMRGYPPVSLVFIIGTCWVWIKKWQHPLTWMTLPFFLFHSFIGHKELRFIFPVILLSPLMLFYFYQENEEWIKSSLAKKKILRVFAKTVFGFNLILLAASSLRPANPSANFYQYIYENDISEFTSVGRDPYEMLDLKIYFYAPKEVKVREVKSVQEAIHSKSSTIFVDRGHKIQKLLKRKNCANLFMTYPSWLLNFNVSNWVSRSRVWGLFHCTY